jgi:hypothetical protein
MRRDPHWRAQPQGNALGLGHWRLRQFQKCLRRKNLDALEGMEREKVNVATDDVGGVPTHSEFEELVVLGIAASCDLHIHINPLGLACQRGQKIPNIFLIDVSPELFSAQNLVEFHEHSKRKQNLAFSKRQIKNLTRLRIGQEQSADEDVRIEDAAQLSAL